MDTQDSCTRRAIPTAGSRAGLAALAVAGSLASGAAPAMAAVVDYDIVYVRQPRYGDATNTVWPEAFHPARLEPGADLVLLHPDGQEEVLVAGGHGSVTDPFVSFDAEWVYYSYFPDLRPERLSRKRHRLPLDGADIYRIHLGTRRIERLTFGEFTPNTGAGRWHADPAEPPRGYDRLGYGILNLGPCPLPGGRVAFTSNRNGFDPPKGYTAPTLQLYVMDEDGSNVEAIAPMTISSALHPTVLRDGRLMFSSHESQGLRDERNWGLWYIGPDGRGWGPLVSAFNQAGVFHFMTQLSSGDVVVEDYYNLNNNGFGALYRFPLLSAEEKPHFHPAALAANPPVSFAHEDGRPDGFRMPFTPRGLVSITPLTHARDTAAPAGAGKYTHPSAAPGDDLLVAWTPGPANHHRKLRTPAYDSGLYLIPGGRPVTDPAQLVLLRDEPAYNEAWPRAVVPYRALHGVDEPADLGWLPNAGGLHRELPEGTPYGLVGTSSFSKRESFPGRGRPEVFDGLEPFNSTAVGKFSNWRVQGADAGRYTDDAIWAVRLVAMEPNSHRDGGPHAGRGFVSHAHERLRILGEIPLRKADGRGGEVVDPEGNPDTSFLARLPADTPFTFQTLDRDGLVLNMAQTWHQVRPGEMRVDCGGCHAHSQAPLAFAETAAARADYPVFDLGRVTPLVGRTEGGEPELELVDAGVVNVEFLRDVRPILERSCVGCHTQSRPDPPAGLVLDDRREVDGLPGDYARLAADERARWGIPPVTRTGRWHRPNASRYVRKLQSRRSLLIWKVFGRRLDGWTNADHPTERVPGDPSTLPAGAHPNDADLDFDGRICPPPGTAPPLTAAEKRTLARWIDLGAPLDTAGDGWGWFLDELRPTLTVSAPRPGPLHGPLAEIRFAAADAYSGLDPDGFSVTADFPVRGRPAGAELADLAEPLGDERWTIRLDEPLPPLARGRVTVAARDLQGNVTRVDRAFSTLPSIRRLPPVAGPGGGGGGPLRPPVAVSPAARPAAPRGPAKGALLHAASRGPAPAARFAALRADPPAGRRLRPSAAARPRSSPRLARSSPPTGGALLADDFERRDGAGVGPSWRESEGKSVARLEGGRLVFDAADEPFLPLVEAAVASTSSGTLIWEFELDFHRSGRERTYSFWMQLGAAERMSSEDPTEGGVAVNLVWGGPDQGLETDEGLGYVEDGDVVQIGTASGPTRIRVEVDLDRQTYSVSAAGERASDIPFDSEVPIDTVRYFAHLLNRKNFEARHLDDVSLRRGEAPPPPTATSPAETSERALPPGTVAD